MPEERDRRTVGLTAEGQAALQALKDTGWFKAEVDIYKAAIAAALARGLSVEPTLAGVETKFNIGTLDNDGQLRALILALAPAAGQKPYEHAERLADVGLKYLKAQLVDGHALLVDALLTRSASTPDAGSTKE